MSPLFRSFRSRSIAASIAVCLVLWTGYVVVSFLEAKRERSARFDDELKISARVVITGFPAALIENPQPDALGLPPEVKLALSEEFNYQVWRMRDHALVGRAETTPTDAINPSYQYGFHSATVNGKLWRSYSLSDPTGRVQVQVGQTVEQRAAIVIAEAKKDFNGLLTLMLPLVAGLIIVATWSARPLKRLEQLVKARAPDDLTPIPSATLPTEAVPLVNAFNELLERVQALQAAQQQFVSDAAHELKTPLAAIRAQAQVAQRSGDLKQVDHALQRLILGVDRAARVSEQLLVLARVKHAANEYSEDDSASTPLSVLVEQIISELEPLTHRRRIAFDVSIDETLVSPRQHALFRIALRNLFDNACRYAPSGSRVSLSAKLGVDVTHLCIENDCAPISETEAREMQRPFVRLNQGDETGSGLGLSIVQRICVLISSTLQLEILSNPARIRATIAWRAD